MSLISVHPAPYQVDRARDEKDYAKHFTKGWWTLDIRKFDLFERVLTTKVWSPIVFNHGHRLGENFVEARWLALDFDTPEYDLAQCKQDWCDTIHVIGLTKNHQRWKGEHPPCDRFRLVVPFVSVINCPRTYEHNFSVVGKRYGADQAVKDKARLFFPCTKIVDVVKEGYMQPIIEPPPIALKSSFQSFYSKEFGVMPTWVRSFLNDGKLCSNSGRNNSVLAVSAELCRMGWDEERILRAVMAAPLSREDFSDEEIARTVRQGQKYGK